MDIEETIFFYVRNDYLIVNNFLLGNTERLWTSAEVANNDYRAVLQEYKDGKRTVNKKDIKMRRRRVYEKLDEKAKMKIISNAKSDILNILGEMQPSKEKITLYRNVRKDDVIKNSKIGQTVEFKIISSASLKPCDFSYGGGTEFYRYEITIPQNTHILQLDKFGASIRNEEGEVLLPPMKCVIKDIYKGGNENCMAVFKLDCVQTEFPQLAEHSCP